MTIIRSQFGHTVLSQLDAGQLCQVLHLLQSGQLDIPAQQQAISQLITRLAALTGETPTEHWESLHRMMGLRSGAPIPARHFPLLSQFLQSHLTLSQQRHPTLATLTAVLKNPIHGEQQQAVEQYCRQPDAVDQRLSQRGDAIFVYLSPEPYPEPTPNLRCPAAPAGDPSAHRDET